MGPVLKQADALNAKFALMQKQLAGVNAQLLNTVRRGDAHTPGFADDIASAGKYRTAAIKAVSATEQFTEALQKQDITAKQALKNRRQFNEVLKEQYRLQRMAVMEWSTDARGRISADMFIPKDAPDAMRSFGSIAKATANQTIGFGDAANMARMRVGLMSEVVRSAGLNMVNLGKNTQWAGRQMMVGISIPFIALGAGAATLSYQIEKELTRIARVYDTTTGQINAEQEAVKRASLRTAKEMAGGWGMAAKETLDITAQLAATGETGLKLQQDTAAVAELSIMGELDRQDAIKAAITLNSVFGDSLHSLGDMYKYINQLENETVVSSQDMVTAIPKLAGVVKGLGGDITDIGSLMAAARAAGIEAGEAANTLKSVSFRNVAPTNKAVETFERLTNVNYQGLIDLTQGDIIPMIVKLQEAMVGLSKVERIQAIRDLQGLWQGSKALNIMNAIWNPETGAVDEQFARAVKVGEEGAEEWRATWDREAEELQQSLPNRFKRAVEAIKFELAEMGKPFLEAAIGIIGGITSIIKAFNGLDDGTKKMIMWGVAIAAIIGPIVMVSGVFLNLLGTIIKLGGSTGMMISRFKAVNAEQRVQGLLSKAASGAYLTQAESSIVLATQLKNVGLQLDQLVPKSAAASAALAGVTGAAAAAATKGVYSRTTHGTAVGGVYQSRSGTAMAVQRAGLRRSATATTEQMNRARSIAHHQALLINGQKDLEKYTKAHNRALGGTTAGIAGAAGMMGLLVGGTNKWVMYTSMALLMYPMFVPLIAKITASLAQAGKIMASMVGLGTVASRLGPMFAGLAAAAGPIGIGIAAAAAAAGFLHYRAKKAREEFQQIADAGDSMVKAMGHEELKPGEWMAEDGTKKKNAVALANEFAEANKAATNSLKELYAAGQDSGNFDALLQKANEIGLNVYNATGDALEARKAVQAALVAAGAVELAVKVRTYFDSDIFRDNIRREMQQALLEESIDLRWNGKLRDDELKSKLRESAESLAEDYDKFLSGGMDGESFLKRMDDEATVYTSKIDRTIGDLLKKVDGKWSHSELTLFKNAGVDPNSIESIREALITNDEFRDGLMRTNAATVGTRENFDELTAALGGSVDAYRFMSIMFAQQTGLDQNAAINGYHLADAHAWAAEKGKDLAGALQETAQAGPGAEGALDGVGSSAEAAAEDALKAAISVDRLNNAQQEMMSNAWGNVLDFASDQYDDQLEREMDGIRAAGEATAEQTEREKEQAEAAADRARKDFEDRWKATMDEAKKAWDDRIEAEKAGFDTRIQGVEDAIEAERDAEKIRQRIFEAEKTRMQRLADLYNRNIDFSAALNSGDLDEAARIGANTAAEVGAWAIDDAGQNTGNAHERKLAELEATKEIINSEKDARLKALDELREAEEIDLEKRKEREQEALKATQDAEMARFEARKKAEDNATENAERNAQKRHEAAKRALEMDLAALQAFVPRNEEELRAHVAEIEATYERHGGTIDTKSREWAAMLNSILQYSAAESQRSLMNDINWAEFGGKAAEDFIMGAFGKTVAEFQAMYGTGAEGLAGGAKNVAPKPPQTPAQADAQQREALRRAQQAAGVNQNSTGVQRHDGGRVNMAAGSRNGYPKSAKRFPSEVDTRLQVGEYVVKRDAVRKLGLPFMNAVNQGYLPGQPEVHHAGGAVGMAGAAGAALSGILQTAMASGIRKMVEKSGNAALAAAYQGREDFRPTPILMPDVGMAGPYLPGAGLTPPDGFVSWMTPEQRGVHPEVLKRVGSVLAQFPGGQRITSGFRRGSRVQGSGRTSLHASGRAVDIGMNAYNAQESALGDQIAKTFRTQVPGVSEVLWKTMTGGNHFDHIHVGFRGLHGGGPVESSMTKGLRAGGYTLNDGYAKLHAREAVLTAPLTQKFEQGVNNFANGGGNQYNVKVDLSGSYIREEIDIEAAIGRAIAKANSKLGIKRKIT